MSKTIVITGSSSGIGKVTAKFFQAKGWNVLATMRNPEKGAELKGLENVLVTKLDVEDKASIAAAMEVGMEKFGRFDVLVNNAGYGAFGILEAAKEENIRRQFEVNVMGLLATTQAILPHFRAQKSGTIINISSTGGKIPLPLCSLYHGTKFAVEGISEALSFELAAIGVKIKIIEPEAIATNFMGSSLDFFNDETLSEYQPLVEKILTSFFQDKTRIFSPPSVVAKVIYRAASDETDQLRYSAGEDAKESMADRKKLDDAGFIQRIKERFGLS